MQIDSLNHSLALLCMATHPPTHPQLPRLQQLFNQGTHTDMVIRVRIGEQQQQQAPAAKRRRTEEAASAGASTAVDQYTDIPTHSLVLCARSPYFDKALGGDWAESEQRRVEVTVENEQELEDLKLLIKLSYSDSYTHDDGRLLPLETRLRLAARADGLKFVEAVDQIVESLPLELGFEDAQSCLDALPPVVEEHPGMAAARGTVLAVLVKGIEERVGKAEKAG
jgi:hypothetical protein